MSIKENDSISSLLADIVEKNSFLRFYKGKDNFFENFSVWKVDQTMKNRKVILNFPPDNHPLAGTADHIFPSADSLPSLSEPFYHMATLSPEDGIRVIYSLIFETKHAILFQRQDQSFSIDKKSMIILAIESKYLHPNCFKTILQHLYNHLPQESVVLDEELEIYLQPDIIKSPFSTELTCLPYDISIAAEIGRFHQFIFSSFRINQVIMLLNHLLAGSSILVTSVSTTQLSVGCFGLLSLLYPIQWPNVFITALPAHLIDCVASPVPFIIGIPFNLLNRPELREVEMDLLVNMDFVHFETSNSPLISSKVEQLSKKVQKLLHKEIEIFKNTGLFPAYRIKIVILKYIVGMILIAANMTDSDLAQPNIMEDVVKRILNHREWSFEDEVQKNRDSLERRLLESPVLTIFCESVIYQKNPIIINELSAIFPQCTCLFKSSDRK